LAPETYHDLVDRLEEAHWWFVGTRELVADLVRSRLAPGSAILDAGCGSGRLLQEISVGYRRTGLDLDVGVAQNRPGLEAVAGSIEAIPLPDESFDGVVAIDVVSATGVEDDARALRELLRVLRPGGSAVIQVAAYRWLRSGHDVPSGTARRYTARRLKSLLSANGFEPLYVGYRVTLPFPAAVTRRLLIRNRPKDDLGEVNPLLNRILLAVIRLENRLIPWLRLPFGLTVLAIARRPSN
jgi:SAM-dependent methyltransferase